MNLKIGDQTYDVTGSGQGLYNTIASSIGALGVLGNNGNGGGLLGGLFGGGNRCSENTPLTRYDAKQMDTIAAQNAEIARLKAEKEIDQKMVEVYTALDKQNNNLRDRIDAMGKELSDKIALERETRLVNEKEQAVFNQSVNGAMATVRTQISQLQQTIGEITTSVVPQKKVCDTGCCCDM